MIARPYLRTYDLALAGGISVQPVRNYEVSGLIPKAQRSSSGYHLYTYKSTGFEPDCSGGFRENIKDEKLLNGQDQQCTQQACHQIVKYNHTTFAA